MKNCFLTLDQIVVVKQFMGKIKEGLKWLAMLGVTWLIFGIIIFALAIQHHETYYSLEMAAFCGLLFAADITAIALVEAYL